MNALPVLHAEERPQKALKHSYKGRTITLDNSREGINPAPKQLAKTVMQQPGGS